MSRIGKQPVNLPDGVTVDVKGSRVTVKGPKGELTRRFDPDMTIAVEDGQIVVTRPTDQRDHRALHGLTRALIANMVTGVSEGYEKRLRVMGTGYRAEMQGDDLRLSLGYSHDIVVVPPPTVAFAVEGRGQEIVITCPNKELIGQVAADIRKLRPPEPYKGKGIRYAGEVVRQKAGKAGKVGG
ncbi:MAG TPA: 50S ribosomal protein L6 [Aggregatilineales bacterium]|nr:50S ribosomal protein L6 [Aggregatilineales bacterium]